jgi:hypothetical protein
VKSEPKDWRSLSSESGYSNDNRFKSSPNEEESVRVSVKSKMGLLPSSLSEESEDRSIDWKEGSNGLTRLGEGRLGREE